MQHFVSELESKPRYEVRLGRLAFRGFDRNTNKPIFEQKRVDVLLSVDIVSLSATKNITDVILVAGDSDLIPAVIAAKNMGVLVTLWHGKTPHNDLERVCDERRQFTDTVARNFLRPQPVANP
ncbi:MAG: NYN domain-containing protein [Elusimicrobia bacterium]|nr:NYN domain-containing protein [Elusimicrobiota bacterium]